MELSFYECEQMSSEKDPSISSRASNLVDNNSISMDTDMIYDCNYSQMKDCGSVLNCVNEAQSPLGQLDPHRLRDMVVDKKISACQSQMEQIHFKQEPYWSQNSVGMCSSPSNSIRSTQANSSSPVTSALSYSRMLQGSTTPQSVRDSALLSPGGGALMQQQTSMCMPGQSPLSSPSMMHPPPSPFLPQPPSTPSPSVYPTPQHSNHYQMNVQQMPQSPAGMVMQSGKMQSNAGAYQRMNVLNAHQPQYTYHQTQPHWTGRQQQSHYLTQPQQLMAGSGHAHRMPVQRVPYPAGYLQHTMSQSQGSSNHLQNQQPIAYLQGSSVAASVTNSPNIQQVNMQQNVHQNRMNIYSPQQHHQAQPSQALPSSAQAAHPQQVCQAGTPMPRTSTMNQYANYYQSGPSSCPPRNHAYIPQMMQAGATQPVRGAAPTPAYITINQQQHMTPMNSYQMYTPAQNSVTQSNILAQHQQQYQAPRYPSPSQNTSGISQCYPQSAQPQLVSPNQASAVQAITPQSTSSATQMVSAVATSANISRNMEVTNNSGTIVPQHARIASQSTPFYGHSNPVQGDMCLLGCHFIVIEYERILFDRMDALEISAVVRMHGGEIEFGCRSYSAHSDRLTHVICESVRHSLVPQALKDRKRCVTLNWLNDVLTKKHLEVPWRVYHLPSVWAENQRPALGKLIATYRFCDYERTGVRFMIDAIGARYTPYITRQNHYLVVKSSDNEITEKCRELGITMVSYQWLVDAYLGLKNFNEGENAYYPTPNMISDVNISPYSLENYCDLCKQLLAPWRSPIMISNEQWQRAAEIKRSVENDETIFPNKKLRCSTPPPTEEQIALKLREVKKLYNPSVICFTGFSPEEMDALGKKIRFLGGKVTDSVVECTHLVVLNLWRTMKLLQAIALGKNIVGFNWITDGYRHQSFPDTLDYFMRDDENEKAYGYNLKFSVLKARYRKIFQDVIFYLTPSVEPSRDSLASLITMAGGKVLEEKPDPKFVARRIESESPLLLISNESDIHLLQYLTDCAMPVFNVEIVLTGILRQKLENSPLYRVATAQRSPLNQSSLQNQPHTAAPVQKAVA